MLEVPVFDVSGKSVGKEQVDPKWFGGIIRKKLLHEAAVIYLANQRAGTHKTKTRGEVAGSKKKPWKQKHTGRARAGTKRSPIWRHGGVVFGPRPRDYSKDFNKKMKRLAVDSALLSKFEDGEAAVLEGLKLEKPQTSAIAGTLEKLGYKESCLLSYEKPDKAGLTVYLSARNIPRVQALAVADLNALDVLRHKRLLITKEAFAALLKNRKEGVALPGAAPKVEKKAKAPKIPTGPKPEKAAKPAAPKAEKPAAKPAAPKKEEKK